mmetsp:Transcript_58772/g.119640  ORF Transcript_58772/g.119640 Transcript_58772/m.119640 type:complete len:257 (+) Transcript_58772:42-812(+)
MRYKMLCYIACAAADCVFLLLLFSFFLSDNSRCFFRDGLQLDSHESLFCIDLDDIGGDAGSEKSLVFLDASLVGPHLVGRVNGLPHHGKGQLAVFFIFPEFHELWVVLSWNYQTEFLYGCVEVGLVTVSVSRDVLLDFGDDLGCLRFEDAFRGGRRSARDGVDLRVLEGSTGQKDGDAIDESQTGDVESLTARVAKVFGKGQDSDHDSGENDEVSEREPADLEGGFSGVVDTGSSDHGGLGCSPVVILIGHVQDGL